MTVYHTDTSLVQLRNDSIIIYKKLDYSVVNSGHDNFKKTAAKNLLQGQLEDSKKMKSTYYGTVTKGVKKNARKAIELMLQCTTNHKEFNQVLGYDIDFQIGLITLTLSDNSRFIPASECHKTCLRPFLDWLAKTKGCKFYVWKAERQGSEDFTGRIKLSNGQLHYHILIDVVIPWQEVKSKWNYLQDNAGYLDEFSLKYNHKNPNSTDIHKMYEVNDLGAYLLKYITKEAEIRIPESIENYNDRVSVEGKVWDCSQNLKGRKYYNTPYTNQIETNLNYLVKTDRIIKQESDFCTMYFFRDLKPTIVLPQVTRHDYILHLNNIIENAPLPKKAFINSYDKLIKDLTRKHHFKRNNHVQQSIKKKTRVKRKYNRKLELISITQNSINYD
jgi:hypothetical protein